MKISSILIVILVLSSISLTNFLVNAEVTFSPLKQLKMGVASDEILCKSNLILVLNHRDLPACIKLDSLKKLESLGWVHSTLDRSNSIQNNSVNMTSINIKEKNQSNALSVNSFQKIVTLHPVDKVMFRPIIQDWKWQFPDVLFTRVTDENNTLIAKDFLVQEGLHILYVENYTIKFTNMTPILLKHKFSTILINDTLPDILPLDDGTYDLKVSSFNDMNINLPERAVVLSNYTKILPVNSTIIPPDTPDSIFHYEMIFRLE